MDNIPNSEEVQPSHPPTGGRHFNNQWSWLGLPSGSPTHHNWWCWLGPPSEEPTTPQHGSTTTKGVDTYPPSREEDRPISRKADIFQQQQQQQMVLAGTSFRGAHHTTTWINNNKWCWLGPPSRSPPHHNMDQQQQMVLAWTSFRGTHHTTTWIINNKWCWLGPPSEEPTTAQLVVLAGTPFGEPATPQLVAAGGETSFPQHRPRRTRGWRGMPAWWRSTHNTKEHVAGGECPRCGGA